MPENEQVRIDANHLIVEFRKSNYKHGLNAILSFDKLSEPEKAAVLDDMVEYLDSELDDFKRSWATSVLGMIGTEPAREKLQASLENLLKKPLDIENTLFYGLKALHSLSLDLKNTKDLATLCNSVISTEKIHKTPNFAAQLILFSLDRSNIDTLQIAEMQNTLKPIEHKGENSNFFFLTRALREFPHREFEEELRDVAKNHKCGREFRSRSIEALGKLKDQVEDETVLELGKVLTSDGNRSLRMASLEALQLIHSEKTVDDLISSITLDEDAEIRYRAGALLSELCTPPVAVKQLVYVLMKKDTPEEHRNNIITTIRHIDGSRVYACDEISKSLGGVDIEQTHLAEKMLAEIGGLAAYRTLTQKQNNIEKMSELLSKSEGLVNNKYDSMISKANLSFSFGMALNVILSMVGVGLLIVAIGMIGKPEDLQTALGAGATGVFSLIISTFINNPRKQGREDLAVVMNASIIYLGFIRQLHHIDLTFKQLYLEKDDFDIGDMKKTVQEIQEAIKDSVSMVVKQISSSDPQPKPDETPA